MLSLVDWIGAWITIIAVVLLTVSLLAYKKIKAKKILIASVVFVLFFFKGILLTGAIFCDGIKPMAPLFNLIDIVILLLLFFAITR